MFMTNKVAAIDLFCGIGGLTKGLSLAGINVIAGFDVDNTCEFAYEHNNSAKFYLRDVNELQGKELLNLYFKVYTGKIYHL